MNLNVIGIKVLERLAFSEYLALISVFIPCSVRVKTARPEPIQCSLTFQVKNVKKTLVLSDKLEYTVKDSHFKDKDSVLYLRVVQICT